MRFHEREPNKFCHDPRNVLSYLLERGFDPLSDGDNPDWWNYATALRGNDVGGQEVKTLFTCLIRGQGSEQSNDFRAWDIQETIDAVMLEFPFDQPFDYKGHEFKILLDKLKGAEFLHYKTHITQGLNTLANYYTDMSVKWGSETGDIRGKTYLECAKLMRGMTRGFMFLDHPSCSKEYEREFFYNLFMFLKLVSDETNERYYGDRGEDN